MLSTAIFLGFALIVVLPSKCVTVRGKVPSVSVSAPMPVARVLGAADGPSEAPITLFCEPSVVFPASLSAEEDEHPASSPPTTVTAATAVTAFLLNARTVTVTPIETGQVRLTLACRRSGSARGLSG